MAQRIEIEICDKFWAQTLAYANAQDPTLRRERENFQKVWRSKPKQIIAEEVDRLRAEAPEFVEEIEGDTLGTAWSVAALMSLLDE